MSIEINLNGGIVANKGFIRQMAKPGTTIIAGKYISAWGGIQSAGQTVGQFVRGPFALALPKLITDRPPQLLQYATEAIGRKSALWIIWVICTAVS